MLFISNATSSNGPYDPIAKAKEYIFLIIDPDESRGQNAARLLTLAGFRAIVTSNTYQAFQRFLQERFIPRMIFLGPNEELSTTLFIRFSQRLAQELQHETPILVLSQFQPLDGNLLVADAMVSTTAHIVSDANSELVRKIWQVLPATKFSLQPNERTLVLDTLPKFGLAPRVARKKLSTAFPFHQQLKAARIVIPPEQWDMLLIDVGLTQFRKEENWPSLSDQHSVPPEYITLLSRAVMFSQPNVPAQQAYYWAGKVESDVLQKTMLTYMLQQAPKVIGQDRTMRTMLNTFANETNAIRGEKLADWKRLDDGSFAFVFYSNLFAYGFMGGGQPSCYVWQAAFDKMLELGKLQNNWQVREVECSTQSHTGHCLFHFRPR